MNFLNGWYWKIYAVCVRHHDCSILDMTSDNCDLGRSPKYRTCPHVWLWGFSDGRKILFSHSLRNKFDANQGLFLRVKAIWYHFSWTCFWNLMKQIVVRWCLFFIFYFFKSNFAQIWVCDCHLNNLTSHIYACEEVKFSGKLPFGLQPVGLLPILSSSTTKI